VEFVIDMEGVEGFSAGHESAGIVQAGGDNTEENSQDYRCFFDGMWVCDFRNSRDGITVGIIRGIHHL